MSKWVKATILPTNDVKVVVKFLHINIFARFDTSRAIISDDRTHFYNKMFAATLFKYGIKYKIASTYHL